MKYFALILSTLVSTSIFAAGDCPLINKKFDQTSLSQMQYKDGTCSLSVSSLSRFNTPYRSYTLLSDGMVMVFNSFGDGPNSSHTGSRVFYFFPRQQNKLSYSFNPQSNELSLRLNSQVELVFDSMSSEILRISDTEIKLDNKVSRTNKGGLDITKSKYLILDMGWRLGGSPTEKMNQLSRFTDSKLQSCEVMNKDLFVKTPDDEYEFRYNDSDLEQYLRKKCPGLTL